jgi:hypothetical protein
MQHKEDKMQRECDTVVTLSPHHCHVDNQHVITINTSLPQNRCALMVQLTAGPAIAWTCYLQMCDMFWLLVHMCVCVFAGTASQFQEMEQTVYNSLFTLIKDTCVLRDYAAAALLIVNVRALLRLCATHASLYGLSS